MAYAWGDNQLGQLGHNDQRCRKLPTLIKALKRKTITQIAIGKSFVVLLGKDVSLSEQMLKKQRKKDR